jgi:PAS domain S-box-containing protein
MDQSLISRLRQRPRILGLYIGALTVAVLALNAYDMVALEFTNLLPHLFYIPIILVAYFFPRRGVLFALVLSLVYFIMTLLLQPQSFTGDALAAGRIVFFITVAAVVSVLSLRFQESEEKYRGVIERSSDIVLLTDTTGKATYVSPAVGTSLGIGPEEIVGKGPADYVHPDDMGLVRQKLEELVKGAPFMEFTVRIRKKDGEYVFINFHGTRFFENGVFAGMQIMGRDVTVHLVETDTYRRANLQLVKIIDLLPDPMIAIDRNGSVVAWNRAMEVLSGLPASKVIGKGMEVYMSWIRDGSRPSLISAVLIRDTDTIKKRYPHVHFEGNTVRTETDIVRVDGTRFSLWVSATPFFGEDGEVTGAIESLRDVTHQKKIERALKDSRRYLDSIINTMADPLFIKDRNHRFITVNDSFCQFVGHSREEMLGKTDPDMFRKEEAEIFLEKDREVFRTRVENENEELLTDSRGKTHTIVTKKSLYTSTSGEEFIVGVIRDITERKKTEQALQLTLRKLNTLSSITRHDILNQLMGLRAFIELTKGRVTDPEKAGFLEKADEAAAAIQRQIEFTRMYEDLGARAPQWQDVESLFREATGDLPLTRVDVVVNTGGLCVYADPLIVKVFYNLVENSLRHGGGVTAISLSAEEEPDGLAIIYRDNGRGISDADRVNLFQKGFGKNTGLGLFLSREILSITGMTLTENGKEGAGVRFEIRVPKGAYRFPGRV